ncbi:hypothetical protein ABPG75_007906 [Micractinium tetrahymenae]
MAANPPLYVDPHNQRFRWPLPYVGEQILLSRGGVELKLEGAALRTRSHKWSARGTVFLSNMRMVFIADKPDSSSGLEAFELPLAYIADEDFRQPILFANNLSGRCFPVEGGPGGGEALQFTLYFKEGGVGTLIPFFFRSCAYVRSMASQMQQQQQQAAAPVGGDCPPPAVGVNGATPPQQFLQTALVDPSDPTKVYLTQPVDASQHRDDAPKFPAPLV